MSPPPSASPPEPMALLRHLWHVDHALGTLSRQMLARFGVTGPQRVALRALLTNPTMTAAELASHLHVDRSSVTGILRRLEAAHLIAREPDLGDGRKRRILVTPDGRRVDGLRRGTVEAAMTRTLAALPASDAVIVGRFLTRFAEQLEHERDVLVSPEPGP